MLVVLSEIDCLGFLKSKGVNPDEFYTDFEMFKNRIVLKTGVDVLVIFTGCCHFNKRKVCEFITQLNIRAKSESDKGVNSVCVISDSFLPNIHSYYKYTYFPNTFDLCDGWKKVKGDVNVFEELACDERECKVFLDTKRDSVTKVTESGLHDDELIKLIKVPVLTSR